MYKLYYYPDNASLAPHLILNQLEVDYELVLVDRKSNAQQSAEYLKLNPNGKIPTLIDNDLVLFESAAICIYLCEKHPEQLLIPSAGSRQRAHFYQWLTYLTNTLQAELMVYYYPQKHTTDESALSSIVEAQHARIGESLAVLDQLLATRQYLLGEQLTACDFFCLCWLTGH